MEQKLGEIVESFTDRSLEEWKADVIPFLEKYYDDFSTHAMTDHTMYLQGQKEMLGQMIKFIKNN